MSQPSTTADRRAADMLTVSVRLFAIARELAGCESVAIELPEPVTMGQLKQALVARLPRLAQVVQLSHFAIGTQYAVDETQLKSGDAVACIPPVSGG